MRPASLPADEEQRVQALVSTGLLDSAEEKRFERLTKLAQQVLHVPVALVSLVDAKRQWFKSHQGLEVCETPRDVSFCAHAILDGEILEIEDARADERFADNPLVVGPPHIRFYAGAPLSTQDGYRIGTLCVIADTPRRLTAEERCILRGLADCVEAEIHNIDLLRQSQALQMTQKLNEVISQAQSQFIQEDARRQAFDSLLHGLLQLTDSEYGFIGEVRYHTDGTPFLKTYAITNIAWSEETRAFYEKHAPQGLEFINLQSLFGAALLQREPVIVNHPSTDPWRGKLPAGHPALHAFLGVPVMQGSVMLAMFGLANRPGGYSKKLLDYLEPLVRTIGQLVTAMRIHQKQHQVEAELSRLSRVASETTNGVVITDTAGNVQWINDGFTRMTGYTLPELIGKKPGQILRDPAVETEAAATMCDALARGEGFEVEVQNYKKDGSAYWVRISCSPMRGDSGQLQGFMAIESDITAQRKAEQELRQFRDTLDQTLDCVYMFDAEDLTFFYANEGALKQVGYDKSALFTMHPYDIKPYYTEADLREALQPLLDGSQRVVRLDTMHSHKNGQLVPVEAFVQYVVNDERPHFVAIVRDITERKQNEERLRHLATHDALTGLPNRSLFLERLTQEIQSAESEHSCFGVLLLDLDNFKVVNDSFGHHQGDYLLNELAQRLSRSLRAEDTVARLGGDEYAAILVNVHEEEQLRLAAERMLQVVSEPVLIHGQEFTPSASIGYRMYSEDVKDAATLLRHADVAMYAAKAAGRGTGMAYCVDMGAVSNEHMHIQARLRSAVEKGAFKLFYQPQVETATGRIIGAEALLRWDDPELGPVSPGRFIPVAEASGQILPLGEWVLETACRQIAQWHAMGMDLQVSINLSPYQFRQEDLVQKIRSACERHHCPVHLLELEITESAAMQSPELTNYQLCTLAQAGFSLALDDFGTGYSSLARLGRLHVNKLKIDRSFIVEIPGSKMYETLVRTTISLGQEMGMQLIAEGVETEAQRQFLEANGCFAYQGWLFSKAVPADEFVGLVQKVNGGRELLQEG